MLALTLAGFATSAVARQTPPPPAVFVELSIEQSVGSVLSKRGDRFPIRLAEPVVVDGVTVLPAGLHGEGEVVHAQASGMAGKPGELTLAARFLLKDGERVPLKAMKLGASGGNNLNTALAVSFIAGPFALFVEGGEVVIPVGTRANAKLATPYPALPAPAPSSSVSEPEKVSTK